MVDPRRLAFSVTTAILIFATGYSVLYNTYLDTSDPLLSHLPHPLHQTHYFAAKSNWLNVVFIKKSWGWTSAVFCILLLSSDNNGQKLRERMVKWLVATASWMLFTSWFFGPSILERTVLATGGECVLPLPGTEGYISVPQEFCHTRSTISPLTHPELFVTPLASNAQISEWAGSMPRLRRGHDISGHIFLLTLSILFLSDQLRSVYIPRPWKTKQLYAVGLTISLLSIWLFSTYTTGVYFHTPVEKWTGFLLGVASFALTQLPVFNQTAGVDTQRHLTEEDVKSHLD